MVSDVSCQGWGTSEEKALGGEVRWAILVLISGAVEKPGGPKQRKEEVTRGTNPLPKMDKKAQEGRAACRARPQTSP